MSDEPDMRAAAQHLAVDLGWPVMPVKPHGKEPLTPHGVKDATTDERKLLHYWERWPDANVGIATGAPGPTVLDVDDPAKARFILATLEQYAPPAAATARGRHLYFAGLDQGTIALGYGELRGHGSYVVCPPSIHPSGKSYTWLVEPTRRLPAVPSSLVADRQPAGVGEMTPRERVLHGERHDHLKDTAVRLLRAGITDLPTLERMLRAEYEAVCDPNPPAKPDEFRKLAEWATKTKIAKRERERRDDDQPDQPDTGLVVPGLNASLREHRAFVAAVGGWAGRLELTDVRRYGEKLIDPMQLYLTNGLVVDFPRQSDITARGGWNRTVIAGTHGLANPRQLKDYQLHQLYRSLCILAGAPVSQHEAEDHQDLLADLLDMAENVIGHSCRDADAIFRLVAALRLRAHWDPFDRNTQARPALVIDVDTDARYLRAGELVDYFRFRGAGVPTREFPGRMAMLGLQRLSLHGRGPLVASGQRRDTLSILLYRLPPDPEVPQDA